jgi:predicted phosphodiesterase
VSKRKRQKRSLSQTLFWFMSLLIVVSMVISLIIVALPSRPAPTPTPWPTWTPVWRPSATLVPSPSPSLMPSPLPPQPPTATEPIIGPVLPSDTPALTPTLTVTPAVTPTLTNTPTAKPTLTNTPTSAGLGFTFAVCGDSRGNPRVYRQVLEAVMADGSEFLVHTGDLVNDGTESQWQAFRDTMLGFSLPFYPVPGNHDGLDGELDGYLQHSGAPAPHYSFDWGVVHFTLADSHHGGITGGEWDWLRDDLGSTGQEIKMVVLHHPPFDPDGTDHIMAFGNEAFMALMVEQEVDYVLTGHIHAYAREERDGVVYVITGGAGAPLYTEDHPQAFYHYLHVAVLGEEVTISVVRI